MFVQAKPVTQTLLDSNWDDGDDGNYKISGFIGIRSKGWSPGWMPKSQNVQATSYCTKSHLLNLKIIWKLGLVFPPCSASESWLQPAWPEQNFPLKRCLISAWSVRSQASWLPKKSWWWGSAILVLVKRWQSHGEKPENPLVFFSYSIFVNRNFPDWHNLTYEGFDS